MIFGDPGPCPICDAPHTTCTADVPSLTGNAVASLPALPAPARVAPVSLAPLAPGEFSTATYTSPRPRRKRV